MRACVCMCMFQDTAWDLKVIGVEPEESGRFRAKRNPGETGKGGARAQAQFRGGALLTLLAGRWRRAPGQVPLAGEDV